jgi:hypothetical protein
VWVLSGQLLNRVRGEETKNAALQHRVEELERLLRDQTAAWNRLSGRRLLGELPTSDEGPISEAECAADDFEKKYRLLHRDPQSLLSRTSGSNHSLVNVRFFV